MKLSSSKEILNLMKRRGKSISNANIISIAKPNLVKLPPIKHGTVSVRDVNSHKSSSKPNSAGGSKTGGSRTSRRHKFDGVILSDQ